MQVAYPCGHGQKRIGLIPIQNGVVPAICACIFITDVVPEEYILPGDGTISIMDFVRSQPHIVIDNIRTDVVSIFRCCQCGVCNPQMRYLQRFRIALAEHGMCNL